MNILTTITQLPSNAVSFAKQVGEIPDHVWHMGIILTGVVMVTHGQKELGMSLLMSGLGMFKGKS